MLKLFGAMLIMIAGTFIGFYQATQLSNRPKQIRLLIHGLQLLETEISYGFTPLPDALLHIGKQISEPVSALFRTAAEPLLLSTGITARESWHRSIQEVWRQTSLAINERDIIFRLGFSLGISDRNDQIKHLRLTAVQLQGEEITATEEQKRFEKMWKSLGLLAGTLIVLLIY